MKAPALAAIFAMAATAAFAQPPPRELFENELTTISGEIVSVDFSQPGASVRVKDARSGVVWRVVGPSSNTLVRGGLKPDEVKGSMTVSGYASKVCASECSLRMREMTFPDGRKVFLGSSGSAPRS
jgi:hypothetical protein